MGPSRSLVRTALIAALLASVTMTGPATSQPAPAPRAVIGADDPPEVLSEAFARSPAGSERHIDLPGAQWLQVRFGDFRIGADGQLVISGSDGQQQTFTDAQLQDWQGLSARFNGSELEIALEGGGEAGAGFFTIDEIVVGLPGSSRPAEATVVPEQLLDALNGQLNRYIVDDRVEEGVQEGAFGAPETICGANDDRVASDDARVGRIMPIGCTGWIIDNGLFLTAGHCIDTRTDTLEFNVPDSQADGTTVAPDISDQYRIDEDSFVDRADGVGADWALFRVFPNTETGQLPAAAQGDSFSISDSVDPSDVTVSGYGLDDGTANQTLQTHSGDFVSSNGSGTDRATLRYTVDTQGGNSGSPVIAEDGDTAIGIHTNGGCRATGGSNAGTGFGNTELWTAIEDASRRILRAAGRISMLRVHDPGTGFGPPSDRLDGEIIVRLDSDPDAAFGLTLRPTRDEAAHMGVLELLRQAMVSGSRVQIEYETTGPDNGRIIRVTELD